MSAFGGKADIDYHGVAREMAYASGLIDRHWRSVRCSMTASGRTNKNPTPMHTWAWGVVRGHKAHE